MAWCKTDASDFFRWIFFLQNCPKFCMCVSILISSKTLLPCLAGLHYISEKKRTKYWSMHNKCNKVFVSFLSLLLKHSGIFEGEKNSPENLKKSLTSVLHSAIWLFIHTCTCTVHLLVPCFANSRTPLKECAFLAPRIWHGHFFLQFSVVSCMIKWRWDYL